MLTVSNITATPTVTPIIPIFTTGLEILPVSALEPDILSAMNFSELKKMKLNHKNNKLLCLLLGLYLLASSLPAQNELQIKNYNTVVTGVQQFDQYLPALKGKKVGIVTNITGVIGKTSIVDTLLKLKVRVKKIFGPEHGFRSDTEAGEKVHGNTDKKTGLPVVSLYGTNKKPTAQQIKDLDVLVYDIQDIGVRFYTYISTMCYAMEACAENNKEFIVLDRPNPNGFYIDGPILNEEFKSFLGLHPVPIVYGMTCGEYAVMANEEGWLKNKVKCKLKVIKLQNYDRKASYFLPVKPSPNIPNSDAVLLYPGLGLFEATPISLGRGTDFPFQVIGHPKFSDTSFYFTPKPSSLSKEPKYLNLRCYGMDLRKERYLSLHPKKINLQWLFIMYKSIGSDAFFEKNFNYHSGNKELQEQIKNNTSEIEIRQTWEKGIENFKKTRKKYLLYLDLSE